ncbi:MAG: bifunctional phosphoribosylaminoimidazolecarboxamide formyltransferase/IMP cyclohydrolase [Pseudomonadota bacterium]
MASAEPTPPDPGPRPIRRALISVSDKTGIAELGRALADAGIELVSTGGTAAALRAEGLTVHEVADLTGYPEMLGGRVKTLHPVIHGALLARREVPGDMAKLAEHEIAPIDLLVVNLYPFEAALAGGAEGQDAIEMIDIGGPALIRAAAKNHAAVAVITDPQDYPALTESLRDGGPDLALRRSLAQTAFARVAAYDAAIAGWMAKVTGAEAPRHHMLAGKRVSSLRYGENPHQSAAFYRGGPARPGVATATLLQGKALSYNNIADADAAVELVAEFAPADKAACAIIKHANPCGVATASTLAEAYRNARDCDRQSAFGGIVALNLPLDEGTARIIATSFTELVIAPGASKEAAELLARRPDLRLLTLAGLPDPTAPGQVMRQVAGGFLLQDRDAVATTPDSLRVVTQRPPEADELADLLFAWRVAKHVKSNAIVFAQGGRTVGIGAGQMSRVDSTRIAARKAADMAETLAMAESPAQGAAVASDAFFPFADGLMAAADAGARAIIQPGGSKRDDEVIAAADAAGLAMVFTGHRHFRH